MSRCWLALVDAAPDASAVARVRDAAGGHAASALARVRDLDGRPRGALAAWVQAAKPIRAARRVDPRVFDRDGAVALVSLVVAPAGVRIPFDDLAVQQARRETLQRGDQSSVSTLLSDASHYEGSLLVARGPGARRVIAEDPFARIFPALLLAVQAGLLAATPPPAGPTIERYGSDQPWPWDRFLTAGARP